MMGLTYCGVPFGRLYAVVTRGPGVFERLASGGFGI